MKPLFATLIFGLILSTTAFAGDKKAAPQDTVIAREAVIKILENQEQGLQSQLTAIQSQLQLLRLMKDSTVTMPKSVFQGGR